ncbi:DNA-directed RNA polymerase subunit epsilon [Halostella pelagica]|uniref:DNA-directed RNA polymerase subunit epsilon n=1 Tax=Halostella pelagica TaxID=2583824 RepID=UPI001080906E|nr:DNA-directed RNA polymerase subunit epsilon [Halostella pelagica]
MSGGPPQTSTGPPTSIERAWLRRDISTGPGDGSLSRLDAVKDERIRRWDVVTPSATLIGRADRPDADVGENLRRLHDEQHPAMDGHSARMHRLEKARITHAFCSTLSLTAWERDRALGIMVDLDLTAFGSQRAIEKVALVVVQYVVDDERRRQLGLHDQGWVSDQSPERLESLYERFESIKENPEYRELLAAHGLDTTSVNRLNRTLREQLDEQDLEGSVLGRSPYRDPSMPVIRDRSNGDGDAPDGTE